MGRPSPDLRSRLTFGKSPVRESRTPGPGAARLAAILAGASPANSRSSGPVVVISSGGKGDRPSRKPGSRSPLGLGKPGLIRQRGASNLAGRSVTRTGKPRNTCPARNGLRESWECRAAQISAKAMSASETWTMTMSNSPGS